MPKVKARYLLHEELNGEAIGPSGELKSPLEDDLIISVTLTLLMKLNRLIGTRRKDFMESLRFIIGLNSRGVK